MYDGLILIEETIDMAQRMWQRGLVGVGLAVLALWALVGAVGAGPASVGPASLVRDINVQNGSPGSGPQGLTRLGNVVFFQAEDAHGWELWKSDGTLTGTLLVKDIWPGSDSSYPWGFVVVGNKVLFVATTPDYGEE